ncbi:MAG TPA: LamG-like jellyroll fold domain-containing protein [Nocardioidaceae bacterium]|nr:LamG-like jellyroll fold domain-containing protein [Nocardioidaceae bacterium]
MPLARWSRVLVPVALIVVAGLGVGLTLSLTQNDDSESNPDYSKAVLADHPEGYWRLEETDGSSVADSAGAHTGTTTDGVELGVRGALAQGDNAVELDGSSGFIGVPSSPSLGVRGDFTVEAWAKPNRGGSLAGAVLQKGGSEEGFEDWEYRLSVTSEDEWRGTVFIGGDNVTVTDPEKVSTSEWTHLVMVLSDHSLRLYVDGSAVASTTIKGEVNTGTGVLAVGRAGSLSSDYFKGAVDEVAVYGRALDADTVAAHHRLGLAGSRGGPRAAFTASQRAGTSPLIVTFTDTSTGAPHEWAWDFGDGTSATAQDPTHRYSKPGSYTVTLRTKNSFGADVVRKKHFVTVVAAPRGAAPVLVGAGDIADCSSTGDSRTAALIERIGGTVFTLGDNAYPDASAADLKNCYGPTWGRFKDRTAFAVTGNHEYYTRDSKANFDYFGAAAGDPGKGYFSSDVGSWHVIVLNSNCRFVSCDANSPQVKWLRKDLAKHPAACTLAMWHHPKVSSGIYDDDMSVQAFWEALYDAGADVILNAHEHMYERMRPMSPTQAVDKAYGITQLIAGTGGKDERSIGEPHPASVVRNNDTHGVLKLTLHDGRADFAFVPEAGDSFKDGGTIPCHGAPPGGDR